MAILIDLLKNTMILVGTNFFAKLTFTRDQYGYSEKISKIQIVNWENKQTLLVFIIRLDS